VSKTKTKVGEMSDNTKHTLSGDEQNGWRCWQCSFFSRDVAEAAAHEAGVGEGVTPPQHEHIFNEKLKCVCGARVVTPPSPEAPKIEQVLERWGGVMERLADGATNGVSQGQAQTPKCRHCGLRIYIGPGLTPASDKLWRHHATNFTECHGGLSTHAEPQVEGQAEPPSHGLECVDGGFRCLCGVTTNLLDWSNGYRWFSAHLLEIVARVSPTAAIDPFDDPKIKNILDRCEAGVVSFSNDDVSELLVRLKQGGTQSQVGERLEEEKPE
jgi:hypothetical protein